MDLDPSKHFSSVFQKDQEEHSTQSLGFGFSGLFNFLFLSCLNKFYCKVNSLFSLLFHHEGLALGSGLAWD